MFIAATSRPGESKILKERPRRTWINNVSSNVLGLEVAVE